MGRFKLLNTIVKINVGKAHNCTFLYVAFLSFFLLKFYVVTTVCLWSGLNRNNLVTVLSTQLKIALLLSKMSGFVATNTAGKYPDILLKISSSSMLTNVETLS